jgi:hypothetical protein
MIHLDKSYEWSLFLKKNQGIIAKFKAAASLLAACFHLPTMHATNTSLFDYVGSPIVVAGNSLIYTHCKLLSLRKN